MQCTTCILFFLKKMLANKSFRTLQWSLLQFTPEIRLDTTKGIISIFKARINKSPGNLISFTALAEGSTNRIVNPNRRAKATAAMVIRSSRFFFDQFRHYTLYMFMNNGFINGYYWIIFHDFLYIYKFRYLSMTISTYKWIKYMFLNFPVTNFNITATNLLTIESNIWFHL